MKTTRKQTGLNETPGFAIKINDDSELCGGMLIAEMEGGSYEPVGLVISVNEAIEIAQGDMRYRMNQLERGGHADLPGVLPGVAAGDRRRLPRGEED